MKKYAFLIIVLIVFSLIGCNNTEDEQRHTHRTTEKNKADIHLSIDQKDAPSERTVVEDLKNALFEKGNNLELTGAETIKSLTEADTFLITIKATAKNNYADCVCELELFYSKYDQGWLIDDVTWNYAEYEQKRTPQVDEMQVYALEYICTNKICADSWYFDLMLEMKDPELEYGFVQELSTNALMYKWKAIKNAPYATQEYNFRSYWQYKPEIDNWVLCENDSSIYGVHIAFDAGPVIPDYTADFSGTWTDETRKTQIEIESFTWDGFDATISWNEKNSDGEIVRKSYSDTFKKTEDFSHFPNPIPNSDYVFISDSGRQCVAFSFGESVMQITSVVQYNHNGNQEDLIVAVLVDQ